MNNVEEKSTLTLAETRGQRQQEQPPKKKRMIESPAEQEQREYAVGVGLTGSELPGTSSPNLLQEQKYRPNEMQQEQQQEEQEHPPLNITKNIMGQTREYYYLTTVKSLKEMDKFRFKNFCNYYGTKPVHICKSFTMPCSRKKRGKTCDFELVGLCPNLEDGIIHIYAHSQHNHVLMAGEDRLLGKSEKELMPDANPPAIFRTSDNVEWKFLQTLPDYDKLHKFRLRIQCESATRRDRMTFWRIRFYCRRRASHNCKFMLMAMRSTEQRFHVYENGEHEHNSLLPYNPQNLSNSKERKQSAVVGQQQNMDEQEQMEDEGEEEEDEEDLQIEEGQKQQHDEEDAKE